MGDKLSEQSYRQIKAYALLHMAKVQDVNHNNEHIIRVKNNAIKIIKLLNIEKAVDNNLLKAICLLHDLTYTVKKPSLYTYIFERQIERLVMREVLEKFNLKQKFGAIIINAVYHHSHSFPFRRLNKKQDVYTKVLQDADTLDFFYCLRIKMFMRSSSKGLIKKIREYLFSKFLDYGINNIKMFLNYPILAKSIFLGTSLKCM